MQLLFLVQSLDATMVVYYAQATPSELLMFTVVYSVETLIVEVLA